MAGKTQYKNKFISDNYDRIFLVVPKGNKALIEEKAKSLNMSINSYISSLINKDMGIREHTQPKKEEMDVFLL